MKKWNRIILFTLLLGLGFTAQAQKGVEITESTEEINDVNGNALRTIINRADKKTISKEWKKLMKSYKASVKTKGNEVHATEVMVSSISEFPIQVYAQINEISETEMELLVIFMNGDRSISSSSDISGYTAAKKIVEDFALQISNEATSAFFENEEDQLKNLEKKLDDLKAEKKKAEKEIEEAKELIKEREYDLKENEKKREETLKSIEAQKQAVKNAKKELEQFK